jgi:hypothetical protein
MLLAGEDFAREAFTGTILPADDLRSKLVGEGLVKTCF